MTPILPDYKPEQGQCLPVALALFLEKPELLKKWKSKKYGYIMAELNKMLPDYIMADCVCKTTPDNVRTAIHLVLPTEFAKGVMIPLFMETTKHAILVLICPETFDMYWYDGVFRKCGKGNLNTMPFTNTVSVWCLRENIKNGLVAANPEELKHLLK